VVLMDKSDQPSPPATLHQQLAAVRAARDSLIRSAQWRAGRKNFDKVRHAREVAALSGAVLTLRNLCKAEARQP
jgi:hypothetical protein